MDISAEALATALEELIAFLRCNGDVHWADVIDADLRWLREGCHHRAGRFLSDFEVTGSLTYLRIRPQNGHATDENSVLEANRELDFLKGKAWTLPATWLAMKLAFERPPWVGSMAMQPVLPPLMD